MEPWGDVADNPGRFRSRDVIEVQTGYREETLDRLYSSARQHFERYRDKTGSLVKRSTEVWKSQHYFYIFFQYIHVYSAAVCDAIQDVCRTSKLKDNRAVPTSTFYQVILKSAVEWSLTIDFIDFKERLMYDNHHPLFPSLFTTIWDTTKLAVQQPGQQGVFRLVHNGHYDGDCFLVLLGVTFTGHLVSYNGLHRPTAYDAHIFDDTTHLHPQHPSEMNIGDCHFSTCANFATPAPKPPGQHRSIQDQIWNNYLQLPRSRIETMNTVFKNHGMFKKGGVFRGQVNHLAVYAKITAHATAVELRVRREQDGPRYRPYGWWPHY